MKLTNNYQFDEKLTIFCNFSAAAMMEQRLLGQDVQGEAGGQDAPVIPMFQVLKVFCEIVTPGKSKIITPGKKSDTFFKLSFVGNVYFMYRNRQN